MHEANPANSLEETVEYGFQPLGGSLVWVALLAVLFFVLAGVVYARYPALWRHRVVLTVLRLALILLLVVVLANPQVHTSRTERVRRQVAVLVDVSPSMGMIDGTASGTNPAPPKQKTDETSEEKSRLQLVKDWFGDERRGILPRLAEHWDIRCYHFADTCHDEGILADEKNEKRSTETAERDWVQRLELCDEENTALGDSLKFVAQQTRDDPLAAVILVTDGRNTKGADPLRAARTLVDRQVPVFAVGIGRATVKDIEVSALAGAEVVFKDDQLAFVATITQTGFDDRQVNVQLFRDDHAVNHPSAQVAAELAQEPVTVALADALAETGTYEYEIRVDVLEGEADAVNNRRSKTVRCVDDALQTLYVEDRPRWEWRFLRDALVLERDKRIRHEFHTVLISADLDASRQEKEYPLAYPSKIEDFERYDLIIFGDVKPESFTGNELRLTAEFVRERAAGFLMIAGRKNAPHSFKGTEIEKILPVKVTGKAPPTRMVPFGAVLTAAGSEEHALWFAADREANDRLWQRLPDLYWCHPLGELQPLARTLLARQSKTRDSFPVLVAGPCGTGTVAVLGTDNTWRWRSVDDTKYYDQFWTQVIQWLGLPRLRARKQIPYFRVSNEHVVTKESVTLTAQVPLRERAASTLEVNYQRDNEGVQRWTLDAVTTRPGTYSAVIPVAAPGAYRAWFTEPDSGESLSVRFDARPEATEVSDPTMNRALLAALCRQTGGQLYSLSTAERMLKGDGEDAGIPKGTIKQIRTQHRPLWGTWPLLFLIVIVVTGEWLYRKKMKLR